MFPGSTIPPGPRSAAGAEGAFCGDSPDAESYDFAPMTAVFHAYTGCSTCKNARRWLDAHGVAYREVDIITRPPSVEDLRSIRERSGVSVRRLFNTSGQLYRSGNYAARLNDMDDETALAELAANGMLIRRPLLVREDVALVGFRPEEYAAALLPAR